MLEEYLKLVAQACPGLSPEELSYLSEGLSPKSYKPKEYYLEQGDEWDAVGYIVSGLVRVFCYDSRGEDVTIAFLPEGYYISELFIGKQAIRSQFSFQCLEGSTIINISHQHIKHLRATNLSFERYIVALLLQVSEEISQRLLSHLMEDAESRYLRFRQEHPDIYRRIPVSALCSFLGVKRQHLTRIRKKLLG